MSKWSQRRFASASMLVACVCLAMTDARAQTASSSDTARQRPIVGATTGIVVPNGPSSPSDPQASQHRGPAGNVCLRVSADARPGAGASRLFSHWIVAENGCSATIRFQVCYVSTRDCMDAVVLGNSRKDVLLGMMPAIKDFRFEYRERF